MYLLYYYILLPVGCSTLRGLFTSYLSYLSTFTVFLHLLFSLSYLYYIILFSISILPVGCYTPTGWVYILFSLSISSHCLPYSFYTIPDLSVLPLWHTFLLLPVGCSTPTGFYTSLLISISSISYSLFSLCTIPYLSVLPLHTHSLSLSYIVYTYYIPPLLPVGYTLRVIYSLLEMSPSYLICSFILHSFIYLLFYLPIHFVINTYFNIYHISINYIYYYIII